MSPTTLNSLRPQVLTAISVADAVARRHERDPRVLFDKETALERLRVGSGIRAWFIENANPSATAMPGRSDYTVLMRIHGLYSVQDFVQVEIENVAQVLARELRRIHECRTAVMTGVADEKVLERWPCYRPEITAEFYALQT